MSEWITKCWGQTRCIHKSSNLLISELNLKANSYCSLHIHEYRTNRFILKSGKVCVIIFKDCNYIINELEIDKAFDVEPYVLHCFIVIEDGVMIEQYFGDCVKDDDIVRLIEGGNRDCSNIKYLMDQLLLEIANG